MMKLTNKDIVVVPIIIYLVMKANVTLMRMLDIKTQTEHTAVQMDIEKEEADQIQLVINMKVPQKM